MTKKGRPAKYITVRRLNKQGKTTQIKTERKVGLEQNKTYRQKAKTKKYTYGATQSELALQKEYDEEIKKIVDEKKQQELDNFKKDAKDLSSKLIALKALGSNPIKYALYSAEKNFEKNLKTLKSLGFENSDEYKRQATGFLAVNIAEQTGETIFQIADAALNRYTTLQENYLLNQALANVKGSINRAKSGISSALQGAKAGQYLGPTGMVVGAAVGVGTFAINQYINYQQRMSGYYQQLNSTNFEMGYQSNRIGLVNNGRGTEN